MTTIQWDEFSAVLPGREIRFQGRVMDVSESFISLDASGVSRVSTYLYGVPYDIALEIDENTHVEGYGRIRGVGTFLGLTVRIDVENLNGYWTLD